MSKYNYLFFVAIIATSLCANAQDKANQQFMNNGFEEWVNEGSASVEPVHWHSFKTATGSYSALMSQQIEPSTLIRPGSSGSRSVRIYPKSIVGITANGNLTSGRINAGSMTPSGSGNYNYTQRSNSNYCTPINNVPDSLSIWVCFRATSGSTQASIITFIHGDADFQCLGDGGYAPADMMCAKANTTFKRTSASKSKDYNWKRISIPFISYPEVCTDFRYIITTFSTNKDAGSGNTSDELFVDDILLIYNPSLKVGSINSTEFVFPVDGSDLPIEIPFTLTGTMSPQNINAAPNVVIAQLSDENGNFDNPTELGRLTSDESAVIQGLIPNNITDGNGYRIRVVSTNYPMVSEDNGTDLQLVHEGDDWVNIEVGLNNNEAGYVEGDGNYLVNEQVTLTAHENGWFRFAAWLEDADTVSKENPYVFTAEENRRLTAIFSGSTDINEIAMPSLSIYPNPTKDKLYLTSDQDIREVVIYSVEGKKILARHFAEQENYVDVKSLNQGLYIIKVYAGENELTRRIVIM